MSDETTGQRTLREIEQEIEDRFTDTYDETLLSKDYLQLLIYVFAIGFFAYHMWYAYTFAIPRSNHGILHLMLILSLWGLMKMRSIGFDTSKEKLIAATYAVYSVLAVMPLYYIHNNYDEILSRAGTYTDLEMILGGFLIILVLIALWKISRMIAAIAISGLIYSYFGQQMPGILEHRGLSIERVISMNTLEMQGLLGTLLQVSATWVVIFLLLAGLMEKYGGMATFVKGATRYSSRNKYIEIGQVAVAASMFMGSINGSTAANTATTGAFTIPLMKENGYKPKLAAATEAVASCGGQVLPPIMGAGAFLMAELINPTYTDIIIGAVAPALMFFLAISISISLNSQKTRSQNIETYSDERSAAQKVWDVAKHYEYMVMFVVLLYYLVYIQADPMAAGFYSIVTLIGLRFIRVVIEAIQLDADLVSDLRLFGRQTLSGIYRGAEVTVEISIILASLGIVIRALTVTGFAQRLSTYIVILAGGIMIALLVLAMLASIAFGMGMSTAAAYMIVAVLVAPALTGPPIGMDELKAHLFVFYFAIVSNITPPIALSVIIAQGIAESEFWETVIESFKIGFPMFLLPFAFVFNESLVYLGPMTPVAFTFVLLGFTAISISFTGQLNGELNHITRLGFLVISLGVIFGPMIIIQALFAGLIAVSIVYIANPTWISGLRSTET